ncbi:MAG: hypothetical protein LUC93_05580 [Planctomycetaceae bacterium]|nr:hypothetical protein [Planctomycetaceae bacterium]
MPDQTSKRAAEENRCRGTRKSGVKSTCAPMAEALKATGSGKGLRRQMMLNKKKLTMKSYIVYGLGGRTLAFVNFCPWCGGELTKQEVRDE